MNKKQLIILTIITVIIAVTGIFVSKSDKNTWSKGSVNSQLLQDFPSEKVRKITIRDKDGEVTLQVEDKAWQILQRGDYKADVKKIHAMMFDMVQTKIVSEQSIGKSQYGRLEILDPSKEKKNTGMVVEMYSVDGSQILSFILGKMHYPKQDESSIRMMRGPQADGRYVKLSTDEKIKLVTMAFERLSSKPEEWLEKEFISIAKPLEITSSSKWTLKREKDELVIADLTDKEKNNSSKISSLSSALTSLRFNDVATNGEELKLAFKDVKTLEVATEAGLTHTLKLGIESDSSRYLKLDAKVTAGFKEKLQKELKEAKEEVAKAPKVEDTKTEEGKASKESDAKKAAEKKVTDLESKLKAVDEAFEKAKEYSKWTYLIPGYQAQSLLPQRSDLVEKKEEEKKEEKK